MINNKLLSKVFQNTVYREVYFANVSYYILEQILKSYLIPQTQTNYKNTYMYSNVMFSVYMDFA